MNFYILTRSRSPNGFQKWLLTENIGRRNKKKVSGVCRLWDFIHLLSISGTKLMLTWLRENTPGHLARSVSPLRKTRKAHVSIATNTSVFKRPPVKWNLGKMQKALTPISPNRISDIILNALYSHFNIIPLLNPFWTRTKFKSLFL